MFLSTAHLFNIVKRFPVSLTISRFKLECLSPFAHKVEANPSGAPFRGFTRLDPNLSRKYYTRLARMAVEKRCSLFRAPVARTK
jgi:hypothetical protein